jgi:serine/threonine protein kinase
VLEYKDTRTGAEPVVAQRIIHRDLKPENVMPISDGE